MKLDGLTQFDASEPLSSNGARDTHQPEPLWFGLERSRCFGMLHEPATPSKRGVIFCNALGVDGLIGHRASRHLANDLTARGIWTLRFDYDGDGDSAGGPWEPGRVSAWIADIDAAVGVLQSRGVSDVQLVGLRAGASLAHLYATNHAGISGVVLWWPYVSGGYYARELRGLSRLAAAARPIQRVRAGRFPEDSLEVAGFEFSAETLADLAKIDLVAAPLAVVPPAVLVIDRIDAAPSDLFIRKLIDAGSKVDHEQMAGYAEFTIDEGVKSVLPLPILHRITDWLAAAPAAPGVDAVEALDAGVIERGTLTIDDPTAGRYPPPEPARDSVIEEPVWIADRLFAIVSSPAGRAPKRRAAVVICSAGAVSRVGPGRLHVNLARYWASLGFTVVRVDLGVGDSLDVDPIDRTEPHAPTRTGEVREVAEWVRRQSGLDSVVLFGLCSGGFNALRAAIAGVDATDVVLVNPGILTLGSDEIAETSTEKRLEAAHQLRRGLMSPRKWRMVLRGRSLTYAITRARDLLSAGAADGARHTIGGVARNAARRVGMRVKSASPLPKDLIELNARAVNVFMVLAAGEATAQYLRVFVLPALEGSSSGDCVELVEIDGGDHVFSDPGARQRLFEETTSYLTRHHPVNSVGQSVPRDSVGDGI